MKWARRAWDGIQKLRCSMLTTRLTMPNNLFVTDGACMASSSCVNPSLTYMALTARACDFAVDQMKRGEL